MLKNMTPRRREISAAWERVYADPADPSFSFVFPCDELGKVDTDRLHASAVANYVTSVVKGWPVEVVLREWDVIFPASGECPACGRTVVLDDPLFNECDCGRWYGGSGQSVRPPWMIEPGEFDDIDRLGYLGAMNARDDCD